MSYSLYAQSISHLNDKISQAFDFRSASWTPRALRPFQLSQIIQIHKLVFSNMPSSDPPSTAGDPQLPKSPTAQTQEKGKENNSKKPAKQQQPPTPADGGKISGAELKKKAKEEKAARRAQALLEKQATGIVPAPVQASAVVQAQNHEGQNKPKGQQRRQGAGSTESGNSLPMRGAQKSAPVPEEPKKEDKTVEFFRHLYKPRTTTIAGASKEVHPAVLALGLQMSNYTICGSCARLVATLQAFKRVSKTPLSDLNLC